MHLVDAPMHMTTLRRFGLTTLFNSPSIFQHVHSKTACGSQVERCVYIYHISSSNADYTRLHLSNNILVNLSNPNGSGRTSVIRRSGIPLNNFALDTDNNCLYAGLPSSKRLIYFDIYYLDSTIAVYKAHVMPRESNSFTELPPFINSITSPYNMHLFDSAFTQCESGGKQINMPLDIMEDYDHDPRFGATDYTGNGVNPDVGADEGAFEMLDYTPPMIIHTPLTNTSLTGSRQLWVTILDNTGVKKSGIGRPMLNWKVNSGTYMHSPATLTSLRRFTVPMLKY